jgi:mono/diheme cytochrome c family protein
MTDDEIADATTYLRNAWGNRAPAASAQQVRKLREALAGR